jgi:xylulokinase
MLLIGLDIGTTGCKAVLFDLDGSLIAKASREYSIDMPQTNWAEQDAEYVWDLSKGTMREIIQAAGAREISAIGLSVQGEAVIPVDKNGSALRPAILGMDTRTDEQNNWLANRFGSDYLFQRTGMPVHTVNTAPKLLWIKKYEPEIWKKAERFLLYEDFLINKMTGKPVISRCLASRTQLFDLHLDGWSVEILNALELDPLRLAPIKPSATPVGEMDWQLTEQLGLKKPPMIVTGGHDQACGALGAGLTRPGLSMVSTGTAEVLEVALNSPLVNQSLEKGNISVYAHVVPELYLAMALNHSGGLLLRWFRDQFCEEEKRTSDREKTDAYDLILRNAGLEPSSLLLLPHFAGSGTPLFDTSSKGAVLGLTFATTKTDFAKAILEGLTFELQYNLDIFKQGEIQIEELRAIGGGARSSLWLQMKADITGIRVIVPKVTEAASWGAALLAGVGIGCFNSIQQASKNTLQFHQTYKPKLERHQLYRAKYELYRQVYPSVIHLLHQL